MRFQTQALITLTLPSNAGPNDSRIVLDGTSNQILFYNGATLVGELQPGLYITGSDLTDNTKPSIAMQSVPFVSLNLAPIIGTIPMQPARITSDSSTDIPIMTLSSPSPTTGGWTPVAIEMQGQTASTDGFIFIGSAGPTGKIYADGVQVVAGFPSTKIATGDVNPIPSASASAVPGCTITFFTTNTNTTIVVWGVFDIDCTVTTASGFTVGQCYLNGVVQAGQAIQTLVAITRSTVMQTWQIDNLPVGTYTVDLRVQKSVAGGTAACHANQSKITAWMIDRN